jgi:Ulp1 family protease
LERKRVEERMGLRHSTKSQYVKNLLRFGGSDQKNIQNSIQEVAQKHKSLVKKIHNLEQQDNLSQDYDENEYINQAKEDLEALEQEEIKKSGLPFLDNYLAKKDKEAKAAAEDLLKKLENDEDISLEEL